MSKQWLQITLGIVTATGGFLDAGTISTAGEAGAKFGLGLSPFLVIMNDPTYLGEKTNGRAANIALVGVLLLALVVAGVSLPLMVLSGGA